MIPCASCGAEPTGEFGDGSPRYPVSCLHPPLFPGDPIHPEHLAAVRRGEGGRTIVELDEAEVSEATACGRKRFESAKRKKRKDYLGEPSLDSHVLGALGERAFAKWINEPWTCSMNGFGGAADVRGVQVRTVPKTSGELKVRADDPDRRPCVLVVSHGARLWLRGWLLAAEARRLGSTADPGDRGRPATFVKPGLLRPMQEFIHHPRVRAAMGLAPEEIPEAMT
jgi:hypothetical protein